MCLSTNNKEINILSFIRGCISRVIPLYRLFSLVALIDFIFFTELINSGGCITNVGKIDEVFSQTLPKIGDILGSEINDNFQVLNSAP
jgi:hypothetical protein